MGFDFIRKIKFSNKYLNCVVFHLQMYCIFTTHVYNLVTVEFLLIKSQLTANAQNVLHLDQLMH
jgi:hypothetical protein